MLNKLYLRDDQPLKTEGEPKKAATVILVREKRKGSWEIFLARRHKKQTFMAGAFVFPGGQLEQSDCDRELSLEMKMSDDFNPQKLLQDPSLKPDLARGFFVCAIRETFEEAGVMLACGSDGNFITFRREEDITRFAVPRRKLNAGEISFAEIIRGEKIFLFPEALTAYSHWITPQSAAKRFDTRFFLARLPAGQEPISDYAELTESLWITPHDALHRQATGEITLMPPTLKTIMELAPFADIDELFAAAKARTIYPILPQEFERGVKLPHDPEYGLADYRRPASPDEPSRIILEDGIWRAAFYDEKKP